MTLRHLEIFRAVCQLESVTLAAERLNMTQPAVSLAIRELERFYGTRLFERMNRRCRYFRRRSTAEAAASASMSPSARPVCPTFCGRSQVVCRR